MGAKMDRTMPRTPQDLERKYNLMGDVELKALVKELLSKVETLSNEVAALKKESTQ